MRARSKIVPWWKTDLGQAEIREVQRAILGRHINQGPLCAEFERRLAAWLGVPRVIAVTNGSQALLIALLACGVGPGDEVIVPAFTFIATAHAALLLGARIKLVDVCRERPLIDPKKIEAAIGPRTKVLVPVHLNGRVCDMATINALAARYGLKVIEDAAQAFGSRCSAGALGTLSDAGAFAMDMTKIITTGEGGFVAVRSQELAEQICRLRNQGLLTTGEDGFDHFGFNFKFPDVLAAIGLAQLRRLERNIAAVKWVYDFYQEELRDLSAWLQLIEVKTDEGELPLWTEVLCPDRDRLVEFLREKGIVARPLQPPLHRLRHLAARGCFPNAEFFAAHALILPCGPDQPLSNLRRVVHALREAAAKIYGAGRRKSECCRYWSCP
ncbi:MAG: DegT/DnrJ/EryC1/StrS family aminotransferase [Kiritimatiellia bacterium]